MVSRYDKEAARLAKLPRAQRFEELMDFPVDFTFKAIGRGSTFSEEVRQTVDALGHKETILVERPSRNGRYCSITFSLKVDSGATLDHVYDLLQALPNLVYLL